jgi:hypothetical protein
MRSSKTARKAKTRKTKMSLPLLPDGNNDRFVRGRSSYKRKLARKLKSKQVLIYASRIIENRLLVCRGITVFFLITHIPNILKIIFLSSAFVRFTHFFKQRQSLLSIFFAAKILDFLVEYSSPLFLLVFIMFWGQEWSFLRLFSHFCLFLDLCRITIQRG